MYIFDVYDVLLCNLVDLLHNFAIIVHLSCTYVMFWWYQIYDNFVLSIHKACKWCFLAIIRMFIYDFCNILLILMHLSIHFAYFREVWVVLILYLHVSTNSWTWFTLLIILVFVHVFDVYFDDFDNYTCCFIVYCTNVGKSFVEDITCSYITFHPSKACVYCLLVIINMFVCDSGIIEVILKYCF